MSVPDPGVGGGGGLGGTCSTEGAVSVLNFFCALYGDGLVEVWGGLGCFNGPHDGYANR